jgi:hypothetical protein
MNKNEIKDIFNSGTTNNIDLHLERSLFKRSIMTGSYAFFGGKIEDYFDVDFILMEDVNAELAEKDLPGFYTGNDYFGEKFSSVYIKTKKYGNIPVNLILCHYKEEFERWKLANSVMSSLLKASRLFYEKCKRDKKFRVELFELCKILKEK